MAIKINFDPTHNPKLPTLILAKKNGEKFGVLKYRNLVIKDCLSNPTEINFTIDKYLDGEKNNFWDEVLNFRAVYCKEWDIWFELTMDIDEADSTIKNVACVELSQAELSQIMLYNIEINTETDIEREDYVNPTVLYNKENPNESLLNRIMEKAGHYSIEYVSPTITNIQRTFTFDDMSLYDAFNKIAEEINCLFVFNSGTKSDGKISRGISVYDLESNCFGCGHRGEFTQKCPKCNSENVDEGYGKDTTIFVTADEIAKSIKLSTDTGAVKNCFKLQAGDDLMTATIRNCNPNGTDYIWYLSNAVKDDMSDELRAKITEYDVTYETYQNSHKYNFHPPLIVGNYDTLINTYKEYNPDLSTMSNPVWGYSSLIKEYYNTTDFLIYLQSELMPNASLSDTNANLQLALLTSDKLSPVSVTELSNLSLSTADNVVLAMARAIVDLRYEVKIVSSSLSGYTWTGRFRVVNYSDEEDAATGTTNISIVINDDYENFLKQKLFETLSKNNEDMSVSGLFDISKSLPEFDSELKKYCLDSLLSFQSICQSCLDILIEQDISASWDSSQDSLYSKVYEPYHQRMKSIECEIDCRDSEISVIQTLRGYIENYINSTHADLDFQNYIGENLWNEFILYRREDKYSNDNYVSDGLNNAELIQKASEFISVAEKEIFKSAELQHSISASLNDFLVIDKFQPLIDYFNVGNWIRIRIDDEIYKLRLLSYEIDFDNLENVSVEFSDVFKTIDGYADQESVISNAAKMSSSYSATQRQASLGEQSQATLDDWYLNGINTATTKIVNEADDQCQIWDRHGMLFKKFDPIKNNYNPNQMKIINSTIALTTDNWTTTKMAIGLFKYVDPTTQEEKEVYGVNGETIIGNLMLGKNLNITNATGSMMFDENGLTVSNGVNTITINPNETYLFNIKNQEEDLLSFDKTDGSLKIVGNIVAKNLKLTNKLDYNKLLYVDSNGLVTGIEIDAELNLSSTNPVQNNTVTSRLTALTVEVGKKAASADVYTKAQADSRITEKVSEIVAGAPEEFDTLREMSDWLLQHAESAAAMNTSITKNASDILALAEATEAGKLDIASRNYIPVRYVSGNKDFNIDFQILAEEPTKVIFANLQKSTSVNAPFPMSETRSYIVSAERLYSSGDLEYVLKLTCVSVQFAGTEYAKVYEHQRFYIKSSSTYWTDWEECGKTADDTSLEKIAELKNDIAVNKSTLGYRIKNLFDVFSVNWSQPSKTTVAEDGTVTTTVTSDPRQFIYSNSDAFVTLGAGTYKIIVNTTDFVSGTYAQINGRDSDNNSIFLLATSSAGIHKTTFTLTERTTIGIILKPYSQTFTVMICDRDFEDESYVPYTNTSVDERLKKFESQPLLYSSTSTEESPLMVNVKGLFRNYSAVICQMYTSQYTTMFNLTLPLKYIKSIGTGKYYSVEKQLFFEYVDDDNLCIRTGMGQSNPTMSGVKIIALY